MLCIQSDILYLVLVTGIILSVRPANERRRYIVTSSLIGWVHAQIDRCCYDKPSQEYFVWLKSEGFAVFFIWGKLVKLHSFFPYKNAAKLSDFNQSKIHVV